MSEQFRFAREVREILENAGVLWTYSGPPRKEAPHALLISGNHSDGYVNVGQVLKERPEALRKFAAYLFIEYTLDVISRLGRAGDYRFDRVVGADTSSTGLAKEIAMIANKKHIVMIKTEDELGKRQVWHPQNSPLQIGEKILQVEELIATSFSALQVREGIRYANPDVPAHFVPILPTVVDRSDPRNRIYRVEESTVLTLLRLEIRNFLPNQADCPYCAVGSEALKPKHGGNWSRLIKGKI